MPALALDRLPEIEGFRSGDPGNRYVKPEEVAGSRQILVTGHSASGEPITSFEPEREYLLRFRVAAPLKENLARGEVDVTSVPETGLEARWIVVSTNVEFLGVSRGSVVKRGDMYLAEFDLAIPGQGESSTVTLEVRTTKIRGELMVTLLVHGEEYRKLTVTLGFGVGVKDDVVCTLPNQLNLKPSHEWTEPPALIRMYVTGELVDVSGDPKDYGKVPWLGHSAKLKNPIQGVRKALDKLRVLADAHLNDLDVGKMARRLQTGQWRSPDYWRGWKSPLPCDADIAHQQALTALACGAEFRALASEGYSLFNVCFSMGSELRGIIEALEPGSRLDFVWTSGGGLDWISHVPWALMYLDPPKPTEPVNCERFLGLRYRIGSKSWEPKAPPSKALGAPTEVNSLHFLYWGSDPNDELREQSVWQRNEFGKWPRHYFVPSLHCKDPKQEVIGALMTAKPAPAAILYFYCHCSVKDGSEPVLQFAGAAKADIVEKDDIYQGPLKTGPLVFANACATLAGDPLGTSELESRFFDRHIRAFLGTETKVPVVLASRFAWLFFQFFLRKADSAPMAAGEALAQARLFLWTQYRNPGGLFYCLVNRYDLSLASDEELRQSQRS